MSGAVGKVPNINIAYTYLLYRLQILHNIQITDTAHNLDKMGAYFILFLLESRGRWGNFLKLQL